MVVAYRKASRTVTVKGIELPVPAGECDTSPEVVFVDQKLLAKLADYGDWDTQFGRTPLLLDPETGYALVDAGLAVKETRGGYHGTDELRAALEGWGWL